MCGAVAAALFGESLHRCGELTVRPGVRCDADAALSDVGLAQRRPPLPRIDHNRSSRPRPPPTTRPPSEAAVGSPWVPCLFESLSCVRPLVDRHWTGWACSEKENSDVRDRLP